MLVACRDAREADRSGDLRRRRPAAAGDAHALLAERIVTPAVGHPAAQGAGYLPSGANRGQAHARCHPDRRRGARNRSAGTVEAAHTHGDPELSDVIAPPAIPAAEDQDETGVITARRQSAA